MSWLLRLRAWQLFILCLIGPMLIGSIVAACFFYLSSTGSDPKYPEFFTLEDKYRISSLIIAGTTLFCYTIIKLIWEFQVGSTLARKLRKISNFQNSAFLISQFLPLFLLALLVGYAFLYPRETTMYPPLSVMYNDPLLDFLVAALPLCWVACRAFVYYHLISVFNKTSTLGKGLFSRSFTSFMLLLFWPLGLWVLQPIARAFYLGSGKAKTTDHFVE